jgi:hypothetical protein
MGPYSREDVSPVYWKPKYATRNKLHRSFVQRQAAREVELRQRAGASVVDRLRRLLGIKRAG